MTLEEFFSNIALSGAGILLLVCAGLVVLFSLIHFLRGLISNGDIGSIIRTLVPIVAVVVLYFIGVNSASGDVSPALYPLAESFPKLDATAAAERALTISTNVEAAFFVTGILGAIAVIGIFFTELSKIFR